MPSRAYAKYLKAEAGAVLLRQTATDARLRPITADVKAKYLHASLAAHVAAWDNYVKTVVREYHSKISNPLDVRYSQIHEISGFFVEKSLKALNTPNRDNARNTIFHCTNYDPIGDWHWLSAGLSGPDVKDFLDEIFMVRHSFAHGFDLPRLSWLARTPHHQHLNVASMKKVQALFHHLVKETDKGLAASAVGVHSSTPLW